MTTTNTTFNTIFIPSILKDIPYSIGKNAEHNSEIISLSSPDDLWFHLDNYPSAHVILHIPDGILLNKKNKHKIIVQGAVLCKANSNKKSDKNVCISYAPIKHVHLTDIPGQVTLSEKKTILI